MVNAVIPNNYNTNNRPHKELSLWERIADYVVQFFQILFGTPASRKPIETKKPDVPEWPTEAAEIAVDLAFLEERLTETPDLASMHWDALEALRIRALGLSSAHYWQLIKASPTFVHLLNSSKENLIEHFEYTSLFEDLFYFASLPEVQKARTEKGFTWRILSRDLQQEWFHFRKRMARLSEDSRSLLQKQLPQLFRPRVVEKRNLQQIITLPASCPSQPMHRTIPARRRRALVKN